MSAVSKQTADKLLAFFDGQERTRMAHELRIIPMGVTIDDALWPPGDPYHVLIVARLVEKKGIRLLLEAWPSVLTKVPNAVLTIAGDGPLRDSLADHARMLGVDVAMPGFVGGVDKHDVMASAGVVIQPSVVAADGDADGLPVALLEGLAAGRIGVASDASGAQDLLVDGVHGFLIPSGDVGALAQAITNAITLDPRQRAHMLDAAREVTASVAWPTVAQQHLTMIGTKKWLP
jgi:glycosyltransferase involved in cell wall biosynthesis